MSVLKTMSGSVPNHGYGILQCGPETTVGGNPRYAVRNLTLDGSVLERGQPGGEYQCHNLAFYSTVGASIAAVVDNVTSINSPCDCLIICPDATVEHAIEIRGCFFSDGFRNAVSFIYGTGTAFSNCQFRNGGVPWGGTNPKSCLDIEPDNPAYPSTRLRFDACVFYNGKTTGLIAQRCNAVFNACVFETGPDTSTANSFYVIVTTADVTFSGCSFRDPISRNSYLWQISNYNPSTAGPYTTTSVLRITGCNFDGVGLEIQGHQAYLSSCNFTNARWAIHFYPPVGKISDCVLQNVGWGDASSGARSALQTYNEAKPKNLTFENVLVRYNPSILPPDFVTPSYMYGIYVDYWQYTVNLVNVRCEGYYLIGSNENHYRDWMNPLLPPPDSTSQTGTIVKNCSMGGPNFVFEQNRS